MSRWKSCNILHVAPDAKRVWQFDAKGVGFVLAGELRVAHTETLPAKGIAKSWASLWQPKLNVAWLPLENVFLRLVELPASNLEETRSMVELQLEKLSPLPVAQVVWTLHVLGTHFGEAKPDGSRESLQTVVVVIAERSGVEEFLGKLEREGFLADRIEAPMIDQLAAVAAAEKGATDEATVWLFPFSLGGQNAALVAWRSVGTWRNLSFVTLPAAGDRAGQLKEQLTQLAWAGELEGWFVAAPKWQLVADPVNATEWEGVLTAALGETIKIIPPPAPAELAARTANRVALAENPDLLPPEFTAHYHQQFVDRLWLRGLAYAGLAYLFFLVVYAGGVAALNYRTTGLETQVAGLSGSYTNAMELKARLVVLQERQQLKYAALDCWQVVAEKIPTSVSLERMSFSDGQRLSLSGSAPQDQVNTLFDFNSTMQKVMVHNQPMFDRTKGQTVNPVMRGNREAWSFSLELLHSEGDTP